jgi:hypothetical protein
VLSPAKVSAALTQIHPDAPSAFKDGYKVEFPGLPDGHSEHDLHNSLLAKFKAFLIPHVP